MVKETLQITQIRKAMNLADMFSQDDHMRVITIGVLIVEVVHVGMMGQATDNARERADFLSIREGLLRQVAR